MLTDIPCYLVLYLTEPIYKSFKQMLTATAYNGLCCPTCLYVGFLFLFQTGVELELQESMPLLEWFANNYKNYGATLEFVTDKSQEGAQFVKGFGGIGGTHNFSLIGR